MRRGTFILLFLCFLALSCSDKHPEPGPVELFGEDWFGKFQDPESGVISYYLKSEGIGKDNSQSLYFHGCEFSNDERFLIARCSENETRVRNGETVQSMYGLILDLKTRKKYTFPDKSGGYPWLDPVEDKLYYCVRAPGNDMTWAKFYRRDLLVDPSLDIPLADFPQEIIVPGSFHPINRVINHVSLTRDRQKVFIDSWLRQGPAGGNRSDYFVWGLLDLYTGAFEEWGRSTENVTHGLLNPLHDDEALCAIDAYDGIDQQHHSRVDEEDGTCRRLQHVKKGYMKTIPPSIDNGATHEGWMPDGDHVYFCNNGINLTNVRTGEQQRVLKFNYKDGGQLWHCNPTRDARYWVFDDPHPDYYRGCRAKVHFWDSQTGRRIYIYSLRPAINDKDHQSNLHPDPHPHFVCNDKYIICTMAGDDLNLHVSITPVDQLIALTAN